MHAYTHTHARTHTHTHTHTCTHAHTHTYIVESDKNVTFFEQLFCFYQLVLVVWNTFGAKFKFSFISCVKQNWYFLWQRRKKLPFPHGRTFGGNGGSGKNHFSGRGFSRVARLTSFYSITVPLVQFFRCSPCLPWQRWLIRVYACSLTPVSQVISIKGRLSTFFIAFRTFDFLDKHTSVQQNLMINS